MLGEVGAGPAVALAGVDPLAVDPRRPRVLLGGRARRHVLVERGREQARLGRVHVRRDEAVVADDELAAVAAGQLLAGRELRRSGRGEGPVAPHEAHRRPGAAGREVVGDARHRRRRLREEGRRLGHDARRLVELQGPERRVHRVAGDVAEGAGAVVPPPAPAERVIGGVVRPLGGGPQEQVPVEARRRVVGLGGPLDGLRPDGPVGPVLHLAHRPDDAGLDPLADEPGAVVGVALVPHLGDDALLAGHRGQGARLGDGPGEGLLAVDVLAAPHRLHRDDRVGVVGSGDDDRVEVGLVVEHAPVVGVGARLGIEGERARGVPEVDVAERRDVLAVAPPHVAPPAPADPDAGDVQGVARRLEPAPAEHAARHDHQGGGGRDPAEEAAAREGMAAHAGTPPGSPARYGRRHRPIISWPVRSGGRTGRNMPVPE